MRAPETADPSLGLFLIGFPSRSRALGRGNRPAGRSFFPRTADERDLVIIARHHRPPGFWVVIQGVRRACNKS